MSHVHQWRLLSDDPGHLRALYGCTADHCVATQVVCTLCEREGNRRRHRQHRQLVAIGADHSDHFCFVSVYPL